MQTYQSTPDYYRDYIEHGWLKDQAAKVHKYIERWRGKNGKWYYRYKSEAQELGAKANRVLSGVNDPEIITDKRSTWGTSRSKFKSTPIQQRVGSAKTDHSSGQTGSRANAGLTAGRKRAAKKGYAVKGYRGKTGSNLSSRGYSRSNSPKATETLNLNGRKVSYDIYDQPSSFLNSPAYYRVKGKNDVFVSRGTNAGRKRVAKKKKK